MSFEDNNNDYEEDLEVLSHTTSISKNKDDIDDGDEEDAQDDDEEHVASFSTAETVVSSSRLKRYEDRHRRYQEKLQQKHQLKQSLHDASADLVAFVAKHSHTDPLLGGTGVSKKTRNSSPSGMSQLLSSMFTAFRSGSRSSPPSSASSSSASSSSSSSISQQRWQRSRTQWNESILNSPDQPLLNVVVFGTWHSACFFSFFFFSATEPHSITALFLGSPDAGFNRFFNHLRLPLTGFEEFRLQVYTLCLHEFTRALFHMRNMSDFTVSEQASVRFNHHATHTSQALSES
jgi:hypothetical protein